MSESSEPDIMYNGAEWFDQNKGKLLNGALAVILGVGGYQWFNMSQANSRVASESALFAVQNLDSTNLVEFAEAYAEVSTDQAGEPVAERALILSARTWLEAKLPIDWCGRLCGYDVLAWRILRFCTLNRLRGRSFYGARHWRNWN